jgi:DNA-binding PadR family transcriptional regulator
LPKLAAAIGLNEAIVLQQLYWLARQEKNGIERNGRRWIYNTYPEWRKTYFPFWSEDTIMRIFNRLEEMYQINSEQPEGRSSRRKHYCINEGGIAKLTSEHFPESGKLQASEADILRLSEGSRLSASSNTKIEQRIPESTNGLPFSSEQFLKAWTAWETHRKEARKPMTPSTITRQLKKLSELGEAKSIAAIEHSITCGYQGIFESRNIPSAKSRSPL